MFYDELMSGTLELFYENYDVVDNYFTNKY